MKNYILSALIAISIAFNLYTAYSLLASHVYKAGLQAGVQSGQSQVGQVMNQLLAKDGQIAFKRTNDKGELEELILIPKPK